MKYESYAPLSMSNDRLEYQFNSIGPKGEFTIVVQFIETSDPSIYSLSFGNLLSDGRIDDQIRNNNKDRNLHI